MALRKPLRLLFAAVCAVIAAIAAGIAVMTFQAHSITKTLASPLCLIPLCALVTTYLAVCELLTWELRRAQTARACVVRDSMH